MNTLSPPLGSVMQVFFMGRLLGGSQVKATGTAPSLPAAGGVEL